MRRRTDAGEAGPTLTFNSIRTEPAGDARSPHIARAPLCRLLLTSLGLKLIITPMLRARPISARAQAILFSLLLPVAAVAAENPLHVTLGATNQFELPYPIAEVYQIDAKLITVEFAKKTAFLRVTGQSIGDTTLSILDVYGNYHATPVRIVTRSVLSAYQWLMQNYATVPGISIAIDSNEARVSGELFSQRVKQELVENAQKIGYRCTAKLHPYVYQVLKIAPEPEPPPPPPPKPKPPSDSKFSMDEFRTSATYPGGGGAAIEDIPFAAYFTKLRDEIASKWVRLLESAGSFPRGTSVTIRFQITKNGRVSYAIAERSSGIESFDRIALGAVAAANPLDSLPSQLDSSTLTVYYRFTNLGR